jgi:hypothetical protein
LLLLFDFFEEVVVDVEEEEGEHDVAEANKALAEEEEWEEEDDELREGIAVEAGAAEIPHKDTAREGKRIKEGHSDIIGARDGGEGIPGGMHFPGKDIGVGLEHGAELW